MASGCYKSWGGYSFGRGGSFYDYMGCNYCQAFADYCRDYGGMTSGCSMVQ
jgi:hypothetical protein